MLKMWLELSFPLLWVVFWVLGGIWITQFAFNLKRGEQALVGISVGLLLQMGCGNLFNHFLVPLFADLLSAALIFTGGLFLLFRRRQSPLKSFPLTLEWLFLFLLTVLFYNLQHGLNINADPVLLAATSKIAAGELLQGPIFPPASLPLFIAAGFQHLAGMFPWNALNLTRSLLMAMGILLTGTWTLRLTRSKMAAWLACFFAAFAMGTSWLLLLIPNDMLLNGLQVFSAPLFTPPVSLPNYFTATFFVPLSLNFSPDFLILLVCTACLLLTYNRWKQSALAASISIFMVATLLKDWNTILSFLWAWIVILVIWLWVKRTIKLPKILMLWMGIFFCADLLAFIFQGNRLELPWSVFKASPINLSFMITVFLQLLPIFCILPLGIHWISRSLRANRWFEPALLISTLPGLVLVFFQFGNDPTHPDHLIFHNPNLLLVVFTLYAVALVWWWASRRGQTVKILAASWTGIAVLSGVMCFAITLTALTQSEFPPGMTSLDALVYTDFWNNPDIHSFKMFDSSANRGEIIFGRQTLLSGSPLPNPQTAPKIVGSSGYRYMYIDEIFWNQLDVASQAQFTAPCVKLLKEYKAKRGDSFRRILDISACQ
jgi:hypothetical protein